MLIKNGVIVSPLGMMRGHLIIDDGKGQEFGSGAGSLPEAGTVIDAEGLHVLPGLIDPHVHFRVPGLDYKEDFDTGSQAAGFGGITSVIDMRTVKPHTSDVELFDITVDCARNKSYCDFGVYAVLIDGSGKHIEPLAEAGGGGGQDFIGGTERRHQAP